MGWHLLTLVPKPPLLCFFASLLLCFFASLLLCFFASLLLCDSRNFTLHHPPPPLGIFLPRKSLGQACSNATPNTLAIMHPAPSTQHTAYAECCMKPAAAALSPPAWMATAQYLNSGILPTGSSAALVSKLIADS